jgi:hypothetical protein
VITLATSLKQQRAGGVALLHDVERADGDLSPTTTTAARADRCRIGRTPAERLDLHLLLESFPG